MAKHDTQEASKLAEMTQPKEPNSASDFPKPKLAQNVNKFAAARAPQPREARLAAKAKSENFVKPPPVGPNSEGKLIMPVTENFERNVSQVSKPTDQFKSTQSASIQMPTEGFVINAPSAPKAPVAQPLPVEVRAVQSPSDSNFSGGSPTLPPEQATEEVPLSSCHI